MKAEIKRRIRKHKATIGVVGLLFVAKFLGFIKNVVLANYYGAGAVSDAYQMAISIPTVTTGILLLSYQAFTKGFFVLQKEDEKNAYMSSFVNFVLVITTIISLMVVIFRDPLIRFFAPGFDAVRFEYVEWFLLPIVIGVGVQVIANILAEYLRAKKMFVMPQAAYLLVNIIEIVTIFLAFFVNLRWLAYGYLLANVVYLMILIFLCHAKGHRYSFTMQKKHIRLFEKIFIPVLLSGLVVEINVMVDKAFASYFETGIVSTINYAVNVRSVLLIIASGGLTVLFPKISKKSVERDAGSFRESIKRTAKIMMTLYVPITIVVILFAKEIVRVIYFRGEFDIVSLENTVSCLIAYSIGMLGICIRDLLTKALYCMEMGKEIILVSIWAVVLNMVLDIILSNTIGYIGLPLATSISAIVSVAPLYHYYRKAMGG